MNFYEKVTYLCKLNGTNISVVMSNIGMSMGTATGWKNGACPRSTVVKKIADYFKIDISYFYNDSNVPPTPQEEKPQIAFGGGMDDLTPEEFDKVYEYIKYLKSQRKN